ncbi:MAG: hypothetical protein ACI88H_002047 [Cocleimonas sp.]|jgi:hypothetical protein
MKYSFIWVLVFFSIQAKSVENEKINMSFNSINEKLIENLDKTKVHSTKLDIIIEETSSMRKALGSIEAVILKNDLELSDSILENKTDIHSIKHELTKLSSQLNNHEKSTQKFIQNASETNWFQDVVIPILLSVIAAIIFWIAFSFLPEKKKATKVRVKIKVNFKSLESDLFFLFNEVLYFNGRHVHGNQQMLRSGLLTKEVLEKYLSFKCISSQHLIDDFSKNTFSDISHVLTQRRDSAVSNIDELFKLIDYLSGDEVVNLERIKSLLNTYSFNNNSSVWVPVNPNISYMTNNLFDLYGCYMILLNYNLDNDTSWDGSIIKIQNYFYKSDWSKCISLIKKAKKLHVGKASFLTWYEFLCYYHQNDNRAEPLFKSIVSTNGDDLVSMRSFFIDLIKDERYMGMIRENYPTKEVERLYYVLNSENYEKEINRLYPLVKSYKVKGSLG